jgi:hypothetical protein
MTDVRKLVGIGIGLILVTGLIHLIDAPGSFRDTPYKGLLFVANALGASLAAWGMYRDDGRWVWVLGLGVAGGALIAYVISRTIGLPGVPVDDWGEPLGIMSMIVEGGFVLLALVVLAQSQGAGAAPASDLTAALDRGGGMATIRDEIGHIDEGQSK